MVRRAICLAWVLLYTSQALSAVYWVAPNGSDANPGSKEQPYRTLQRVADALRPGDTCIASGGTYREEVRIGQSGVEDEPIRFTAADGEKVILDGTDLVPGPWIHHSGNIYRTSIDGPIEQVFANGRMQIEARWPNMRFEEIWDRTKWASSEHGSCKDLMICDPLAETGIDWSGAIATLNVGHQYKTWTRDVKKHSQGSDQFTYDLNERLGDGSESGASWADDRFYLSGKLEALDAPTEWFHDVRSGTLYLWCEDGTSIPLFRQSVDRALIAYADQTDFFK